MFAWVQWIIFDCQNRRYWYKVVSNFEKDRPYIYIAYGHIRCTEKHVYGLEFRLTDE